MTSLARLLLCLVVLPTIAQATSVDDENARLRTQVEQLKTELEAAKSNCVATGAPAAAAVVRPAPATTVTAPLAAVPGPSPAAATAAGAPTASAAAEATEVPKGYKLVKIEPVIPKDDRWKERSAWESLHKGMSKDEVESLLGVEHSRTEGGGRVFWGYGKIGVLYSGSVIFVGDRLAVWTLPDF